MAYAMRIIHTAAERATGRMIKNMRVCVCARVYVQVRINLPVRVKYV